MYNYLRSSAKRLLVAYLNKKNFELAYKAPVFFQYPEAGAKLRFAHILGHHLLTAENFFFVQIGAFDGVHNDPLFQLIKRFRWPGVLVEPQPNAYNRLKKNYEDQPQLRFENAAIFEQSGERDLFVLEYGDSEEDSSSPLSSFDRAQVEKHAAIAKQKTRILVRPVQCITLQAIFEKHRITKLDLLQVDAEGYDGAIIRSLDFDRLKPRIIRYEHVCMSVAEQQECLCLLARNGYKLCLEAFDTTAFLP